MMDYQIVSKAEVIQMRAKLVLSAESLRKLVGDNCDDSNPWVNLLGSIEDAQQAMTHLEQDIEAAIQVSMDEQKERHIEAVVEGNADDVWKSAHGLVP